MNVLVYKSSNYYLPTDIVVVSKFPCLIWFWFLVLILIQSSTSTSIYRIDIDSILNYICTKKILYQLFQKSYVQLIHEIHKLGQFVKLLFLCSNHFIVFLLHNSNIQRSLIIYSVSCNFGKCYTSEKYNRILRHILIQLKKFSFLTFSADSLQEVKFRFFRFISQHNRNLTTRSVSHFYFLSQNIYQFLIQRFLLLLPSSTFFKNRNNRTKLFCSKIFQQ